MHNKYITITVDVEDFFYPRPPDNMYFAKLEGDYYGITKIMDICEENHFRATFFIDVINVEKYVDEGIIAEACQEINKRGHEVGLHTHPPKRIGDEYIDDRVMKNYNYEYQYRFIEKSMEKITKWTNITPKSHRAGSYALNKSTFSALDKAGIHIDSSIFWKYDNYDFVYKKNKYNNNPFFCRNILELPILSYNLKCYFFSEKVFLRILKKTDLNWCSFKEFKKIMNFNNLERIELFMHSFSLVDKKKWKPNYYFIENLNKILAYVRRIGSKSKKVCDFVSKSDKKASFNDIKMNISEYSMKDLKEIYFSNFGVSRIKKYLFFN